MKKTPTSTHAMQSLTLCIAVTETRDIDSPAAERIYRKIQLAIDNDGCFIYNGNGEKIAVPFAAPIRAMYRKFLESDPDYQGPFEGWDYVDKMLMVEGARCTNEQFIELVTKHFSKQIVAYWCDSLKAAQSDASLPVFLGDDVVAIRCDMIDGIFFEHIIENSAEHKSNK